MSKKLEEYCINFKKQQQRIKNVKNIALTFAFSAS